MTAAPILQGEFVACVNRGVQFRPKNGNSSNFTDWQITPPVVEASGEVGKETCRIVLRSKPWHSGSPTASDSRNFPVSAGILLSRPTTSAISGQYPVLALISCLFAKRLSPDYVILNRTSRRRSSVGTATAVHWAAAAARHSVDVGARVPEATGDWRPGNRDAGRASRRGRFQYPGRVEILFTFCV